MPVNVTGHAFITSVKDGEPGKPGKPGPMFYPAGVWHKMNTYARNDDTCPFVLYDTGNPLTDNYYYPAEAGTITGNTANKTPNQDTRWKVMNSFEVIQTKVLFARMGLLGSAVFYDDYMFSQHGKSGGRETTDYSGFSDGSFQPNFKVNLKTGELTCYKAVLEGASISGAIKRKSQLITELPSNSIVITPKYNIYQVMLDVDSVGTLFFSPGISSADLEFEIFNLGLGKLVLAPPAGIDMFVWRGRRFEHVYLDCVGSRLDGIWSPISPGFEPIYDSMFIIKNQSDFYADGKNLRSIKLT